MFRLLKKTALWIVAVPYLAFVLGCGMNDAVMAKNDGGFPVQINRNQLSQYDIILKARATQAVAQAEKTHTVEDTARAAIAIEHIDALEQGGFLDQVHIVMTPETHLNWLADWIDVGFGTASPGDIFLWLGQAAMEYSWFVWFMVVVQKLAKKEE